MVESWLAAALVGRIDALGGVCRNTAKAINRAKGRFKFDELVHIALSSSPSCTLDVFL